MMAGRRHSVRTRKDLNARSRTRGPGNEIKAPMAKSSSGMTTKITSAATSVLWASGDLWGLVLVVLVPRVGRLPAGFLPAEGLGSGMVHSPPLRLFTYLGGVIARPTM
jgi:hypothetical protein